MGRPDHYNWVESTVKKADYAAHCMLICVRGRQSHGLFGIIRAVSSKKLTHLDDEGRAHMVDVGSKTRD